LPVLLDFSFSAMIKGFLEYGVTVIEVLKLLLTVVDRV
jgi:hypothetical protein